MEKEIDCLETCLYKLEQQLTRMKNIDLDSYGTNERYNYVAGYVNEAMKFAIQSRELIGGYNDCEEIINELSVTDGFRSAKDISFEEPMPEVSKVTIGRLLPKKTTENLSRKFLASAYYLPIRDYYLKNTKYSDERKMFVFAHYYDNKKITTLRDYDNQETKILLDMLVPFFVPDDSPKFVSKLSLCDEGEVKTEIYILPVKKFYQLLCNPQENHCMDDSFLLRVLNGGRLNNS